MMTGAISGAYHPYDMSVSSGFAHLRGPQSGVGRVSASGSGNPAARQSGVGQLAAGSGNVSMPQSGAGRAAYGMPQVRFGSNDPAVLWSDADGKVTLRNEQAQGADEEHRVKGGYKSSPAECQTCRERKYQDGSNESDVSFKAPGHISPEASAATVMAHEQQHVSNAYQKAAEKQGKVISARVSLHTSVCPECGTSYVAGGTTSTSIAYPKESGSKESNPYEKNQKAQDAMRVGGTNINHAA